MSVTGHIDGEPGAGPMKVGPSIVDYMTGMNTSIAILAALYHRKVNGGDGQHLDVCLFDTVIASLSHYAQIYLVNGKTPPRRGTWGNGGMPAGVFRCADGELMLVVGNDAQFARTCAVLGEPGARHRSEIRQEQRPRRARQGDHGDLRRPVPEEQGRLLAGRAGEGRRALRSRSTISRRCLPIRMCARAAWRSRSTTPSSMRCR